MHEPSVVKDFLNDYRAAFESFDAGAIADHFSYPFQITSDAGEIAVSSVPAREAWLPQLERLVAIYRQIGVHTADMLDLQVQDVTTRLGQGTVHWGLVDVNGGPIYDFTASYTLADFGDGLRITAIAHNESPRLRAYLESHRPG